MRVELQEEARAARVDDVRGIDAAAAADGGDVDVSRVTHLRAEGLPDQAQSRLRQHHGGILRGQMPSPPSDHTKRAHPRHPTHLVGSLWTRAAGFGHRHYTVVEFRRRARTVVLEAALDQDVKLELPWRALRDRAHWQPGWVTVVDADDC